MVLVVLVLVFGVVLKVVDVCGLDEDDEDVAVEVEVVAAFDDG